MKSTLNKTTTTLTEENVSRYLDALNEMKKSLDKDKRFAMQSLTKKHNISRDLSKVLKKGRIIRNLKIGKYPEWEWISIKPNRLMAIRTLEELEKLRQSAKKVKANNTTKEKETNRKVYVKVNNTSIKSQPKPKRKYTKKKIVEGYQVSFFFGLFKINIKPIYKTK